MKTKLLLSALSLGFIFSCSDDDDDKKTVIDTTKPVIEISSPAKESKHHAGEKVIIKAKLTDNEGLKSYKIDIHRNADGHSHRLAKMVAAEGTVDFDYDKEKTISGKEYMLVDTVTFNAKSIHGEYHILVKAIDQSNNENQAATSIDIEGEDGDHKH